MSQTISRSLGTVPPTGSLKAPIHLSRAAKRWWRSIVENYDLEPHHIEILTAAAEALDRKDQARTLIAEEGIVISDGAGAPMMHPAVQVEDTAAVRMAHLIREIGLDVTPPDVRLP